MSPQVESRLPLLGGIVLALLSGACTSGVQSIQRSVADVPNPDSYVFDLPVDELSARAEEILSRNHQYEEPIFVVAESSSSRDDGFSFHPVFQVENAQSALFAGKLLESPANQKDLYLHNFDEPIWPAPVHPGRDGGLPYCARFHVHLAPAGEGKTRVTVFALHTSVVNGRKWGIGPCGPGYGWRSEKVEPTSIEEYTILRYLGRGLGRKD